MDDYIERKAAIKALGDSHFKNYGNAIMVIKELSAANVRPVAQLAQAIANLDCFQDACPCDKEICKNLPYGCFVAWLEWLKNAGNGETEET